MGNKLSPRTLNTPYRIIVLGLSGAGKTTLFTALSHAKVQPGPTTAANAATFVANKLPFLMYDLPGGDDHRRLWRPFYKSTDLVIFMVDSTDPSTFAQAKEVLHGLTYEATLVGVPVCVLMHKQDLPSAVSREIMEEALDIAKLRTSQLGPVAVIPSSTNQHRGLDQCLAWVELALVDRPAASTHAATHSQSTAPASENSASTTAIPGPLATPSATTTSAAIGNTTVSSPANTTHSTDATTNVVLGSEIMDDVPNGPVSTTSQQSKPVSSASAPMNTNSGGR